MTKTQQHWKNAHELSIALLKTVAITTSLCLDSSEKDGRVADSALAHLLKASVSLEQYISQIVNNDWDEEEGTQA